MGFAKERFESDVESAFLCAICENILQRPKSITVPECEHIYCGECLHAAFSTSESGDEFVCPQDEILIKSNQTQEPMRFFQNLYGALNIRCSFYDKCETVLPVTAIEHHEIVCDYNPANFFICDGICGIKLHKKDLENHKCGDYFKELIKKLSDRIDKLEVNVSNLKKNSPSIAVKNENKPKEAAKKPIENAKIFTPVMKTKKKNLLELSREVSYKFQNFKNCPASLAPQNEWFVNLLNHLISNPRIKDSIYSSEVEKFIDEQMLKSLQTFQLNSSNKLLILSIVALEYLESCLTSEKTVVLISLDSYTLSPMFASLVKDVYRMACHLFCSVRIGKHYKKSPLSLAQKLKYIPYTPKSMLHNFNKSLKVDMFILFHELPETDLKELIQYLKPNGFLLILDHENSFRKITKTSPISASDTATILVDRSEVSSILH